MKDLARAFFGLTGEDRPASAVAETEKRRRLRILRLLRAYKPGISPPCTRRLIGPRIERELVACPARPVQIWQEYAPSEMSVHHEVQVGVGT
ncbi:MAG TPA: hypothetical protein PLI05_03255 [Methanotrichaceae archaeon]|nr:hypothetical protein [Methanotrichaceae archaeon]HQF16069.1 hypothetical protein [Methanotrichaceae archaeon]HQI90815.1 hypothetical protein [Methanotrichaceae archaeon]HQJ28228.1 hypothetical protein [Methanotrichaceae archaeon]